MKGIEDSARGYMVSLAAVREARKLKKLSASRGPAPKTTAAPPMYQGPSQLEDAICCLMGVRDVLIKMGHSKDGSTIRMIDRALRRRHE